MALNRSGVCRKGGIVSWDELLEKGGGEKRRRCGLGEGDGE